MGRNQLLLRLTEAAWVLNVGRTTVYDLVRRGELHAVHIGCIARISRRELEQYAARLDGDGAQRRHGAHLSSAAAQDFPQPTLFDLDPTPPDAA